MTKPEIEKLIDQQEKVFERNYRSYQETGIPRYEYAYRRAENLIDLGRMALSAADDHQMAVTYKGEFSDWGNRAFDLTRDLKNWDEEKAIRLLKDIAASAKSRGLVWDRWQS